MYQVEGGEEAIPTEGMQVIVRSAGQNISCLVDGDGNKIGVIETEQNQHAINAGEMVQVFVCSVSN